jgi:hypothetical protein
MTHDKLKQTALAKPEVKAAYESLEPEFVLLRVGRSTKPPQTMNSQTFWPSLQLWTMLLVQLFLSIQELRQIVNLRYIVPQNQLLLVWR